ncbi:MAG TPA: hypothetical protein VNR87_02490 [Flavisolibacter sp.]|nr:hypothetical protein [Flavisolibacter sp.]
MSDFTKTIKGIPFNFRGFKERGDQVYQVSADTHHFKMTSDDEGNWGIWQQVPAWIKALEGELEKAIEEQAR